MMKALVKGQTLGSILRVSGVGFWKPFSAQFLVQNQGSMDCLLFSERQPFLDSTILPEECVTTCQFTYIHMITQNERPEANYILCDILKAMQAKLYHNQARVMFPVSMQ